VAVSNLQGRGFLEDRDHPFTKAEDLIDEAKKRTTLIFTGFHAEATSEEQALAWYVDSRVSAVIGPHTHTQTADNMHLPLGTAYMTYARMTGPYDAILGVNRESIINRFLTNMPARFEVDKNGPNQLNGCLIKVDEETGKATTIDRIMINEDHPFYE